MTPTNKNLFIRIASAAVLAPILSVVIIWDRPEPMTFCVQAAVIIGLVEFYWIVLRDDPVWMRVAGVILGALLGTTIAWPPLMVFFPWVLVGCILAAAIMHLLHFGDLPTAPARTGLMVWGFLYVPLLLTPLALFKRLPDGVDWIFLTLTVTWFSDTGAYAVGRLIGKRKLYKAISPGKSMEGAAGGLTFSFLAAVLAKFWYMPQLGWIDALLVAIPGGALGQIGDLVESMIKRGYKVKDSGWIIPGHGGLLDRIDALVFCIPWVYIYSRFFFTP